MAGLLYIVIALLVIGATWAARLYAKNRRFWELFEKINGVKTLPLIGHAHHFSSNSEEIYKTILGMFYEMKCRTFKVRVGNATAVVLCEPETVEVLLGNNKEITKMDDYFFLRDWLGDGLLTATGNKWRRHRKIITPAFHFKILEQFINIFNEKGDILIKKLSLNKGKVFDIHPYITLYALDVICQSAMGLDIKAQENAESEYVQSIYKVCEIVNRRSFSVWKRIEILFSLSQDGRNQKQAVRTLHSMTNGVIKSRKILLRDKIEKVMSGDSTTLDADEDNIGIQKKVAFLDLLLLSKTPEGKPLSDQSIREETDTFMFEGHDTTASGISFTIYALANNPEVQRRVVEEQRCILGDDLSKQPTYADLQDMKYLEMVIKETLRMYPSVPAYGRKLMNDLPLPDGTIIPAGAHAVAHPLLMGRNPKCYENPEIFDPERFSPENSRLRNPYAFASFSAGPRNCIGQKFAILEMKSILSKILRTYELFSGGPGTELRLAPELILKSKSGHQVILKNRFYKS